MKCCDVYVCKGNAVITRYKRTSRSFLRPSRLSRSTLVQQRTIKHYSIYFISLSLFLSNIHPLHLALLHFHISRRLQSWPGAKSSCRVFRLQMMEWFSRRVIRRGQVCLCISSSICDSFSSLCGSWTKCCLCVLSSACRWFGSLPVLFLDSQSSLLLV